MGRINSIVPECRKVMGTSIGEKGMKTGKELRLVRHGELLSPIYPGLSDHA